MQKRKGASGSYCSDERRAELGKERLYLRPPIGTRAKVDALAAELGCTKADLIARIIDLAIAHKDELEKQ